MQTDFRSAALAAIEDGQFADAERHLRAVLEEEPQDAITIAVLALCVTELGRADEADGLAQRAVTLEPFLPYPHWVQGVLFVRRRRLPQALVAASEALRLDADDPDHHALVAQVHAAGEQWAEALAAAERGLELDPLHESSANLRALALGQLGRTEEAARAFSEAMAANPLNAFAIAGKGWSDLASGNTADADAAFRDALLFDPTSEWAREGMVAALKSRSPVYRQLLRYFLWMSGRTSRERTLFAVGGVIGYNFLQRLAKAQPELAPVIWPVLIAYGLFVVLSWIADPLLDLMLSFDSEGRRLLSRVRLVGGRVVGACLALAIALAVAGAVTSNDTLLVAALGFAGLTLPLAAVFQCEAGWPRMVMAGYTGVLLLLLIGSAVAEKETSATLFGFAILGIVLGTWLARWLAGITPGRESKPAR